MDHQEQNAFNNDQQHINRQRPSALQQNTGQKQSVYENENSPGKSISADKQYSPQGQNEAHVQIFEPNWWEFRFIGKQPERRGYHSSFTNDKKFYVYGGKDIGIGHLNNLWSIDLSNLNEFIPGQSEYQPNSEWALEKQSGQLPPSISNHTSVVFQNKMFLFGGSSKESENLNLYSLDLHKYQWTLLKPKALNNENENLPKTRDEHTALILDDSMIVFGGFAFGQRTNDIFKYYFKSNTWEKIKNKGNKSPCPRAGHSAVICHKNQDQCMIVFGGKDDDNQKLSDTWMFNFRLGEWRKIDYIDEPVARSGHTSQLYLDNFMIVYGGIYEVTKELNDMHVFDIVNEKWLCLFEEINSPVKQINNMGNSPSSSVKKEKTHGIDNSPRKSAIRQTGNFQQNLKQQHSKNIASPQGQKNKKPRAKLEPLSTMQIDDRVIKLESPTSITMRNSFLIKNADPSFEKCYAQIKKRAIEKERTGMSTHGFDDSLTKLSGKRPPARDGHSSIIIGDCMYVFGGDRHCMPFNDFYMLDLKSEFQAKSYLF